MIWIYQRNRPMSRWSFPNDHPGHEFGLGDDKTAPSRTVLDWLNAQDAASLYVTTITLAEIGYGLRLLPDGQRRRLL